MAKPNYQFEKRQRELAKKQKKAEKEQRKAQGHSGPSATDDHEPDQPGDDGTNTPADAAAPTPQA
ncbi:MAG: hypothetical protein RIQ60_1745 [Pseudomonadota bacterium]|jgi:hypothetical protein